jgi:hypothetical protein
MLMGSSTASAETTLPACSVEKPFLKPVILSGPHTGERRRLLEMLVQEFPDVFAFPQQYTTRPPDLHSKHIGADGDELQLVAEQTGSKSAAGSPAAEAAAPRDVPQQEPVGNSGVAGSNSGHGCHSSSANSSSSSTDVLGPPPRVLSKEDFEAAVANGQLLEHHADLFTHPLAMHRHGHSMEDIQAIIKEGKLPLLELEAEQTEQVKVTKAIDCLSIFMAPPSLEEHEQLLQLWVTESDDEVVDRGTVAAAELTAVQSQKTFDQVCSCKPHLHQVLLHHARSSYCLASRAGDDLNVHDSLLPQCQVHICVHCFCCLCCCCCQVLVNDELEEGYKQLKAAISRFRPDLIPPAAHEAATKAAQAAAALTPVPVLVAGPAGVLLCW